jgi:hypothetical protein
VADAFEAGMAEAEAQELLGVGPDGKKKKGKGQSGIDLLAAQMENMKRMLEEKEGAMRQMAEAARRPAVPVAPAGVADAPGRPARWRGEVRPRAWICASPPRSRAPPH